MNREEIIRIAREVGIKLSPAQFSGVLESELDEFQLERFANHVVAHFLQRSGQHLTNDATRRAVIAEAVEAEREACAKAASGVPRPPLPKAYRKQGDYMQADEPGEQRFHFNAFCIEQMDAHAQATREACAAAIRARKP